MIAIKTIIICAVITASMILMFAAMTTQPGYEDSPSLLLPHPVWGAK